MEFTITNTDGAMPSISPFSTSGDETTHTATVSFTEDGDYAFSIFFTDLAGNTAEYEEEEEFTIDTAMPEYTVSYDDAGAQNEYYYDAQRTATTILRPSHLRKTANTNLPLRERTWPETR